MVTWATGGEPDGHDSYDGPEWAAPESAGRHLHTTEARGIVDPEWAMAVELLGDGLITAAQFQEGLRDRRRDDAA